MKIDLVVLFGGQSVEHDISVISAIQVMNNLDRNRYNIIPIYLNRDNVLINGPNLDKIETFANNLTNGKKYFPVTIVENQHRHYLISSNKKSFYKQKIDLIWPIVHGKGVEDGNIAGWLELLKIPFPTCNTKAAAICQDKHWTKVMLRSFNIKVLDEIVLYENNTINFNDLSYPVIVKPASLGSSIGINKVKEESQILNAIEVAFKYDNKLIIEQCLENFREFACAIYKKGDKYIVSDIEEINIKEDIFKFSDKYEQKEKINNNCHIIPALISEQLASYIKSTTTEVYKGLELKGIVRVDFLYDNVTKECYVNEINTIPGALAYYLFEHDVINFASLLDENIKEAFLEKERKNNYQVSFPSSIFSSNISKLNKYIN